MAHVQVSKISLGTVNFGIPYGAAGDKYQVPEREVEKILAAALEYGVDHLDTAIGYGIAQDVLGRVLSSIGKDKFRITSKLLPIPEGDASSTIRQKFIEAIEESCKRLKVDSLDGCLLHRATDASGEMADTVFDALNVLKHRGLVKKIGISAYTEGEIRAALSRGALDVVQVPFSIADQRLLKSKTLDLLKSGGTEIHVRSVFMQGILLQDQTERSPIFEPEELALRNLAICCRQNNLTPLQACLGFAMQVKQIDQLVLGVQSAEQFYQILQAAQVSLNVAQHFVACDWKDEKLLNPANWDLMKADLIS
ncbi:MAG: aldo/keto reductase [Thalassospira sp.]|uniref:aldo/keto reductase n=1 Tax=Thalassospira sp. TaxID=1912094 RepID=UPI0032ED59EE